MKRQTVSMGMPVTVVIADSHAKEEDIEKIFLYFDDIDTRYSPFKNSSEVSQINAGFLKKEQASKELKKILLLSEQTKQQTQGFFNVEYHGRLDPSGLVKGYAIQQAAQMLLERGYKNFFIEIAGDIQTAGVNTSGEKWRIGIENPFDRKELIKVVGLSNTGIATSGTYIRGQHIYNPVQKEVVDTVVSLSVIGPNVYEADRFATAAFAMGEQGLYFLEQLNGFEAYMVMKNKKARATSGFHKYVI